MLTYDVLPDHIKRVAEQNNHANEKLDVLPSCLKYDGQTYYVIEYCTSAEHLFVREDGSIPPFEEIKRGALVVRVYGTAGNTLTKIAKQWLSLPTISLNKKLINKLLNIKEKVIDITPQYILLSLDNITSSAVNVIADQKLIFKCVDEGLDLIIEANETEIVTEEIQKQVRQYVVEVVRAAVRQNQEQLDTEGDRKELIRYLGSILIKRPSILPNFLWFWFQSKNMLTSKSKTGRDMEELQEMVKFDKPIDELGNKAEILAAVRNPK